jgi:hypothetical protein
LTVLVGVCASTIGISPASADTVFKYTVNADGNATVTGCNGSCDSALVIPATIGGHSVVEIGNSAFRDIKLSSVVIPDSVLTIGDSAFYGSGLSSVKLGQSVSIIAAWAFTANNLSSVILPKSVTIIGTRAFQRNRLTSVTIPESVTNISQASFKLNKLTFISIPNSVTNIGVNAFADNDLTSVTIPESVSSINDGAFCRNLLDSVRFLGNAPQGGKNIFTGNVRLSQVDVGYNTSDWGSKFSGVPVRVIQDTALAYTVNADGNATVTGCDGSCDSALVIPATIGGHSVVEIGNTAFRDIKLSSVVIPDSVLTIGHSAFYGSGLSSVKLGHSVRKIREWAFNANNLSSVILPNSVEIVGRGAFQSNRLTSAIIPKSVTEISQGSFKSNQLTFISIPDSVTNIGVNAFADNDLTSVTIPESVTSINDCAFCRNLLGSVRFLGNAPRGRNIIFTGNVHLSQVDVGYNTSGWGSKFSGVPVRVNQAPDAPTVDSVVRGNGWATVNLVAPSAGGGSKITHYILEYKESGAASWPGSICVATSSTLSYKISGLKEGVAYEVRVSAIDAFVGQGRRSSVYKVTRANTPSVPKIPFAKQVSVVSPR